MKILISGGSSGIGRALVERRLQKGDEVCATTSRDGPSLEFSKPVVVSHFNLSKPEENSTDLCNWISNGVDGLILNATVRNSSLRKWHEYETDEIMTAYNGNVFGNMWLLKKVLAKMSEQKFGRILFISSMTVHGSPRYSLYSSAKAALEALVRGIASDYGELGITANIIRPGVIETDRTRRFWKRTAYVEVMKPLIPLLRFGQPEDVAIASDVFLDPNCYATGSTLEVAGGLPQIRTESLFKVGL
jgi:3-oxoacyl-[acyl-carrier protein] reductase